MLEIITPGKDEAMNGNPASANRLPATLYPQPVGGDAGSDDEPEVVTGVPGLKPPAHRGAISKSWRMTMIGCSLHSLPIWMCCARIGDAAAGATTLPRYNDPGATIAPLEDRSDA